MKLKSNKKGYTLELSEEELSHLKNALAVAELKYNKVRKELAELNDVRSNDINSEETYAQGFYYQKADIFSDMILELNTQQLNK